MPGRGQKAVQREPLMKLYSWNVNGIRSVLKKDALLPFIKAEDPDVLCLQETKAQPGEAVVDAPAYQEYWNSAEKKGYSGTAIYSKVKPLSVRSGLPQDLQDKYAKKDPRGRTEIEEVAVHREGGEVGTHAKGR